MATPKKVLSDKEKEEIKALSRLFARNDLGLFKGASLKNSVEEISGKPDFATMDSIDRSRPHSFRNNLADFSSILEQGNTGGDIKDFSKSTNPNRADYLKKLSEKRKDWADLVPLSTVDRLLKGAPEREDPSEYLGYISDTFGIGPAESRKKGAKEAKVNDFFRAKYDAQQANKTQREPTGGPSEAATGSPRGADALSSLGSLAKPSEGAVGRTFQDPNNAVAALLESKQKTSKDQSLWDKIKLVGQKVTGTGEGGKQVKLMTDITKQNATGFEEDFFKKTDTVKEKGGTVLGKALQGLDKLRNAGAEGAMNLANKDGSYVDATPETTNYSEVLDAMGVKNKAVRAIGGFVGDVALDPLTYATLGTGAALKTAGVKTIGKVGADAAVQTAGAKAFKEVVEQPLENFATKVIPTQGKPLTQKLLAKATTNIEEVPYSATNKGIAERIQREALENTTGAAQKELVDVARNKTILTPVGEKIADQAAAQAAKLELSKVLPNYAAKHGFDQTTLFDDTVKSAVKPSQAAVGLAEKKAAKVGKDTRYQLALQAQHSAEDEMRKKVQKSVQFKIAGKTVASSTRAYDAMSGITKRLGTTPAGESFNAMFRTASYLPGDTRATANRFMNVGMSAWEDVDQIIRKDMFGDLSDVDAKRISHAIEKGDSLADEVGENGADLATSVQKARAMLDDTFDLEKQLGVYKDGTEKLDNYVHHTYLAAGKNKEKTATKALRQKKKVLGTENPGFSKKRLIPTLDDAKTAGLDPVEDIRDILSIRMGKSHQVRARAGFAQAVADQYGVNVSKKHAKQLGLVKAESKFLPKDTYVPEGVAKAFQGIEELHTNTYTANAFSQYASKITNTWKVYQTGINPAFHVRGVIGDGYLNYLDGVSPTAYPAAAKMLKKTGNFRVGNVNLTGAQMWDEFTATGARSSFGVSELPGGARSTYVPKQILDPVRALSESRENFTRAAHFKHSVSKYGKNAKTMEEVREAGIKAAADLDHYNFNYMDLTPTEKKIKKVVPFYTFSRKNIPLQLESLFLKPGKLATKTKAFHAMEVMMGTDQSSTLELGSDIPDWAKEAVEEAKMSGETISTGPGSFLDPRLPSQDLAGLLGSVESSFKGEEEDTGQYRNVAADLLSRTGPLINVPTQLAFGKQLFGDKGIYDNKQFLANQKPGVVKNLLKGIDPKASEKEKKSALLRLLASNFDAEAYVETEEDKKKAKTYQVEGSSNNGGKQ